MVVDGIYVICPVHSHGVDRCVEVCRGLKQSDSWKVKLAPVWFFGEDKLCGII